MFRAERFLSHVRLVLYGSLISLAMPYAHAVGGPSPLITTEVSPGSFPLLTNSVVPALLVEPPLRRQFMPLRRPSQAT